MKKFRFNLPGFSLYYKRYCNGFTLIELMVAISIVALLSVLALVSFNALQKNGRDTRRRSEVEAIADAIEQTRNQSSLQYNFTSAMLANEFPPNSPTSNGSDPANYNYCIFASATSTSTSAPTLEGSNPPTAASGTGSCGDTSTFSGFSSNPDSASSLAAGVASGGILNTTSNAKSWVLCAYMETASTPFCIANRGSK